MKRIVLVHGEPGSGKTWLSDQLSNRFAWRKLSVDETYVEFVNTTCPEFYFPYLRRYIAPHYAYMLSLEETKQKYGRDFVLEWCHYLFDRIVAESSANDKLVVEGWLLRHLLRTLRPPISQAAAVMVVEVVSRTYWVDHMPVTIEGIDSAN